jgi:hypothetical protein
LQVKVWLQHRCIDHLESAFECFYLSFASK